MSEMQRSHVGANGVIAEERRATAQPRGRAPASPRVRQARRARPGYPLADRSGEPDHRFLPSVHQSAGIRIVPERAWSLTLIAFITPPLLRAPGAPRRARRAAPPCRPAWSDSRVRRPRRAARVGSAW